jgi:hypothetical protein
VLLDHAGLHEAVHLEAVQIAIELLRRGRPEVGHRQVEALGELVARRVTFEQSREHGVAQRHLDSLRAND